MKVLYILLILVSTLITDQAYGEKCVDSESKSAATRLLNDLFCSYDKNIRPVLNQKTQTVVNTTMYFFGVHMDEEWNVLKLSIHLVMIWKDEFLTWDPTKYENVETTQQLSSSVWLPDIMSYDTGFDGDDSDLLYFLPTSSVKITYKGIVKYNHRVTFTAQCSTNIAHWPFDTHNCTVIMGSPIYTNLYVNYSFPTGYYNLEYYTAEKEWEMKSVHQECYPLHYISLNNSYEHCLLQYELTIKRFSSMYFSSVIIPAAVLSLMSTFTFLLGREIMIRIILLALFFISELFYIQFLNTKIPNNGSHPVYIVLLYRNCLIQTAISLFISVLSNELYKRGTDDFPPESPEWLKSTSAFLLSRKPISMLTNFDNQGAELLVEKIIDEDSPNRLRDENAKFWKTLSILVDRLSFIITLILIFINFMFLIP
ncbi:acetylcholine receptor subunit alpha-1-B-like [Adelges cooleyi]|uniref:acetylcholine receptor subunit alpha-1-B-like n=1 Tax=Adelges cooleyi TaxID=133065 RepID=UPI0021803EE9|nr:acetylcholine receptor subunit alpha-1-B-like [Adelges cooleyi]